LDTHIFIRWISDPKRLSKEQAHMIQEAARRRERVALSAASLLEIALLYDSSTARPPKVSLEQVFAELEASPFVEIVPITVDVAREVHYLEPLRDPSDRTIVATARVHGLRLLTSDQRIIESNFVSTVE